MCVFIFIKVQCSIIFGLYTDSDEDKDCVTQTVVEKPDEFHDGE